MDRIVIINGNSGCIFEMAAGESRRQDSQEQDR